MRALPPGRGQRRGSTQRTASTWLTPEHVEHLTASLDGRTVPDLCPIIAALLVFAGASQGGVELTPQGGQTHRWWVDQHRVRSHRVVVPGAPVAQPSPFSQPVMVSGQLAGTVYLHLPRWKSTRQVHRDIMILAPLLDLAGIAVTLYQSRKQQHAQLARIVELRDRVATKLDTTRHQLERDLHDGAQNELVSMQFLTTLTEQALRRADHVAASAALTQVRHSLSGVEQSLAHAAAGALPPMLNASGIGVAVNDMYATNGRVQLQVSDDSAGRRYPAEIEAAALYVCSEAVNNCLQHGATGPVIVDIDHNYRGLLVQVKDSGPGFSSGVIPKSIIHLRRRAEAVGGRIDITTSDTGTQVTASFPL